MFGVRDFGFRRVEVDSSAEVVPKPKTLGGSSS